MVIKTIRIKKKGGGSRLQRVEVLDSGKYKFLPNNAKTPHNPKKSKASKPKKRRNQNMANNKKKKRRNGNHLTATAMKMVRITALAAPAIDAILEPTDNRQKLANIVYRYTGYNMVWHKFAWEGLAEGWSPYIGSIITTRGVSKLSAILRRL